MLPRMSFASYGIAFITLSLSICESTILTPSESNQELPWKLPCPNPDDITPCECTFNETLGMYMDCSNVTNDDELRRVFNNSFSFTDFTRFTITENDNITSLEEGVFGSSSFKEIHIHYTSLSEIEDFALMGSHHTLVDLRLSNNKLESLPDISNFTRLEVLWAISNQIKQFPILASETLLQLNLGSNQIDDVPEDAIVEMPLLQSLYLDMNSLTEIHPNTYTQNAHLNALNLGANNLSTIPDDAIALQGNKTGLFLHNNQITNLTHEAVSSVTGSLGVSWNSLTELPEEVFRPLLEDSVDVILYDNPFECGCDMAWLVFNQTLLGRIDGLKFTKCQDGVAFPDLDPEAFKVMCPNATAVPYPE